MWLDYSSLSTCSGIMGESGKKVSMSIKVTYGPSDAAAAVGMHVDNRLRARRLEI